MRSGGGGGSGGGAPVNLSVYPPSYFEDRPLERVQVLATSFYRPDNPDVSVTYAFEGDPLVIRSSLKNYQNIEQQVTLIVQISDDTGSTVYIGTASATLGPGKTSDLSVPWTVPQA